MSAKKVFADLVVGLAVSVFVELAASAVSSFMGEPLKRQLRPARPVRGLALFGKVPEDEWRWN